MDRGTYTELSQNDVPVELEAKNAPLTEPSGCQEAYPRDEGLLTDYVLVYETCKEEEEKDQETKKEAETLANLRRSYEKRLQKKGLILQRKTVTADKVFLIIKSMFGF